MKYFTLFISLLLLSGIAFPQKTISLASPDKNITCDIRIQKDGISYRVTFNKKVLISYSALSLQLYGKEFLKNVGFSAPVYRDTTETYTMIVGKTSKVNASYREVTVPLTEKTAPHRKVNLVFRAFDDGIAFRYQLSGAQDGGSFEITSEQTEFRLTGNPRAKVLQLPNYRSSHEGFYTTSSFNQLGGDTLMAMPALFQFSDNAFMAITEAALLDYAGMYLIKRNNVLTSVLSPLPSDTSVKVKGKFPHVSPWRVMLIGDNAGDMIASDMLNTLSPPQKIKDVSWIKPGKTTFPWWNGNVTPDTLNAPGNNFVTQQYYIDFCARNGIEYHSVVEYGLHQWYVDDGVGFQPGPNNDVTKPVPGLDMKEVCDYAHSKGVGVRVWVHWAALYPRLDSAFAIFEKWGLSGMMIDFMDRDDQEMVNIQTEMLEKAAKHKLHIQFHGAYKPTGLNRTYPNEFTREGTLNYEVNKWGPGLTAQHDLDIAFTRLIAGPTDYHLGGFRAVPDSLYKVQYTRPLMLGTRSHMLALFVVFESALGMVCDYPAAYEGEPGFEFIKTVPTTWDETKVLQAIPDEYIVIARRKGNDWYVGAINNKKERQISIPLSFSEKGNYEAEIYSDDKNARQHPNKVIIKKMDVSDTGTADITLAPDGGTAIILRRK
jgi:alpha-glucosidase